MDDVAFMRQIMRVYGQWLKDIMFSVDYPLHNVEIILNWRNKECLENKELLKDAEDYINLLPDIFYQKHLPFTFRHIVSIGRMVGDE